MGRIVDMGRISEETPLRMATIVVAGTSENFRKQGQGFVGLKINFDNSVSLNCLSNSNSSIHIFCKSLPYIPQGKDKQHLLSFSILYTQHKLIVFKKKNG